MKVKVVNLGVLKQAEIELKPLTVFIGPNSSGKTWLAYAVAGIFGSYGQREWQKAYKKQESGLFSEVDESIREVGVEGFTKFNVVDFVEKQLESYINSVAALAPDWLSRFFDTELVKFDKTEIKIQVAPEFVRSVKDRALAGAFTSRLARSIEHQDGLVRVEKEAESPFIYIYTISEEKDTAMPPLHIVQDFVLDRIFRFIHRIIFADTAPFPVERTFYITYPYSAAAQKLARNQLEQSDDGDKSDDLSGTIQLPVPVRMFMSMMTAAFNIPLSARQKNGNSEDQRFLELAADLENMVLQGKVEFSEPEPHPSRKALFASKSVTVELPIASSMVKELSSLALYLRFLAEKNDLVVIDEPEMNLHPEAQAKIVELLSMMVNAGLNVLVTTHSTYIVDHLANLMKAAKHDSPDDIEAKFLLQDKRAFIDEKLVSVYLFDNGTATPILDGDVIDWDTFSKVSAYTTELYDELD